MTDKPLTMGRRRIKVAQPEKIDHTRSIGTILTGAEQRDAIHLAIAPAVAGQILAPGDHVGLLPGSTTEIALANPPAIEAIGIVDPFLKAYVQTGERCWLFLYPQTITSLRHEWTHPAFADVEAPVEEPPTIDPKQTAEAWLRAFADELGLSYGALMSAARDWIEHGDYYVFRGHDTPDAAYLRMDEFWLHYQTMTGVTAAGTVRSSFFTCSC